MSQTTGMEKNLPKVVLDTNVLISAIIFGGKPRQLIKLIQEGEIIAVTTPVLLAELFEILTKKFQFTADKLLLIEDLIKENFIIVYPSQIVKVLEDDDDNRVIEAALEGKCRYIISGDSDLLQLGKYRNIKILMPATFLTE